METNKALTLKEAEIVALRGFKNLKQREVAESLGVSPDKVKRTMRKKEARELLDAAVTDVGIDIKRHAALFNEILDSEKVVNVGGEAITVVDNMAKVAVLKELNKIRGVYAPEKMELRHSMASMDDTELENEIDAALEEISLERRLEKCNTSSPQDEANISEAQEPCQ